MMAWSVRNFSKKEVSVEKNYPGSMEFDHSKITNPKIPFFTSHLETFLKIIHRSDWGVQSYLLRTDEEDFNELPKFNKMLLPRSKKDLAKLDQFIYHYYYSGPHSDIDFNPMEWAIDNGIAKEQARAVLPEGLTKSRLYVNGTIRSWIHFIELRSGNGTQKEHMELARAVAEAVSKIYPEITNFIQE